MIQIRAIVGLKAINGVIKNQTSATMHTLCPVLSLLFAAFQFVRKLRQTLLDICQALWNT